MRRQVPVLSLLGSLILLPACETAAPPPPAAAPTTPSTGPNLDPEVEIHPLRHAVAAEVADAVNDVIRSTGDRELHVVAEPRLNALIVHGDPVLRAHVRDLADALDRPPED